MTGNQQVIPEVFDAAMGILALDAQAKAIAAERNAAVDQYLEVMRGIGRTSELVDAMRGLKIVYGSGYSKRLTDAGFPSLRDLAARQRSAYNDGEGLWRGAWPLDADDVRPAKGTWVVYQLFQGGELLYIGSTRAFYDRIKAHSYKKDFDAWRAAECPHEDHCRELEAALIDRDRPPLNRMIATPRMVLR